MLYHPVQNIVYLMSATFEPKKSRKPDVLSFREALLPRKQVSAGGCLIWGLSLMFTLFQFFIQLSAGQMVYGLMNNFNITALGAGFLVSAYYYVYVTLQTPAGLMMGRYGPRLLLTLGAVVLSIGAFTFALAHWLWLAFFARMLMGLGAAFAFVGSMNLADKRFPRRYFALLAALVETVGMFGTLVGVLWLATVIERLGWRVCMLYIASIGLVLSILMGIIVRDSPVNRPLVHSSGKTRRILPGLLVLIRMRSAWINGLYCGLMFTIITVFASLWCVPFLQEAYGLSLVKATFYTSLIYVGVGLAGPCVGIIDHRLTHRRFLMASSAALAFLLIVLVILWTRMPVALLGACMFFIGVVSSGYVLSITVANEIAASRIRSASIGFLNTLCVGTAPLLQPLVGLVLVLLSTHEHPFDTEHYSVLEYQLALMVIPLCLAIAAWLGLYIPSKPPDRSIY